MKRLIISAVIICLSITTHAQNVPQMASPVSVGVEGITITADSAPNPLVVQLCYQSACSPAQTPKLPLVVNCSFAAPCKLLGGDPAVGQLKTLYVQQQAAAFTVTLAGVPIPMSISAITQPVVTPPTSKPIGFTLQFTCTFAAGASSPTSCATTVIPAAPSSSESIPLSIGTLTDWRAYKVSTTIPSPTRFPCPKGSTAVACYAN